MADVYNWWAGKRVKESDLDGIFANFEAADHQFAEDIGCVGIVTGMEVTENSPEDLTVVVAAGLAIDKTGRRLRIATDQTVDLSLDELGNSTNPASGNEVYISVRCRFARQASDTQGPDLSNNFVAFQLAEFFEVYIELGDEALIGAGVVPALHSTDITLADVLLVHNATQIQTADISMTRAEYMIAIGDPAKSLEVKGGTPVAALGEIAAKINDIVDGSVNVAYSGIQKTWADATNVFTAVPQSLSACVVDAVTALASIGSGTGNGTSKIGSYTYTVGSVVIATGTLRSQLQALTLATNISHPAAGNIAATTVGGWLTELSAEKAGLGYANVFTSTNNFIGNVTFTTPCDITFGTGTEVFIASGADFYVQSGGDIVVQLGGAQTFLSGSTLTTDAGSTTDLNGAVSLDGATTQTGAYTKSGNGATTFHRRATRAAPGASTTISVTADYWYIGNPTLPCSCTVTAPTGEPAGLVIHVYTVGQLSDTITFKDAGTTMFTFVTGTPAKQSATLIWDGAAWEVAAISANATLAAGY